MEVLDEGTRGEDVGEARDELGGGRGAHGGREVGSEVGRLGGECGVSAGGRAREGLDQWHSKEARVGGAERREEGRVS